MERFIQLFDKLPELGVLSLAPDELRLLMWYRAKKEALSVTKDNIGRLEKKLAEERATAKRLEDEIKAIMPPSNIKLPGINDIFSSIIPLKINESFHSKS